MGQLQNVFLLVAIAAIMAVATAVLAFLADMLPLTVGGNFAKAASDSLVAPTVAHSGH
ncbi:MAG TPA: hypothetical protein VJL54_08430 [Nitrososphaera sp.]|nr:hypothetical protein [Nitrososphaera sp.]